MESDRSSEEQVVEVLYPQTLGEVKALEEEFSEDELRDIVYRATLRLSEASQLQNMIVSGLCKPSLVWGWREKPRGILQAEIFAALWMQSCKIMLGDAAKERRRENSSPANEVDAAYLAKSWVRDGHAWDSTHKIPTELRKGLQTLFDAYNEQPKSEWLSLEKEMRASEHMTKSFLRLMCESLGVAYVDRSDATLYAGEGLWKERKPERSIGGVIMLRAYDRRLCYYDTDLIQAAKFLHLEGLTVGSVGVVSASMFGGGLSVVSRWGSVNWPKKEVVTTRIQHLFFSGGRFREKETWERACGFIKAMGVVSVYNMKRGSQYSESETDSD